jgi:hypothetical protein
MKKSKIFIADGREYTITVTAILSHCGGNSAPHFSITGAIDKSIAGVKTREVSGGCIHPEIKKHFPGEFDDIIKLHLSDIDGVPMYAVENGFYFFQQDSGKGYDYIRVPRDKRDFMQHTKQDFVDLVDSMRPTWKAEAIRAIEKHSLEAYTYTVKERIQK